MKSRSHDSLIISNLNVFYCTKTEIYWLLIQLDDDYKKLKLMPKSNSLQINMSAGGGEKRPLADKVPDFEFKDILGNTWLLSSPTELHRLVAIEDFAQLAKRLREEEIEEATINATCTIGAWKEVRQEPLSLLPR